jgi:hypothetical protein
MLVKLTNVQLMLIPQNALPIQNVFGTIQTVYLTHAQTLQQTHLVTVTTNVIGQELHVLPINVTKILMLQHVQQTKHAFGLEPNAILTVVLLTQMIQNAKLILNVNGLLQRSVRSSVLKEQAQLIVLLTQTVYGKTTLVLLIHAKHLRLIQNVVLKLLAFGQLLRQNVLMIHVHFIQLVELAGLMPNVSGLELLAQLMHVTLMTRRNVEPPQDVNGLTNNVQLLVLP